MSREGHTVTLDATASRDPDGEIHSYLWELGDGTLATGSRVKHTYRTTGAFDISLVVIDGREGMGFTSLEQPVVIEPYRFGQRELHRDYASRLSRVHGRPVVDRSVEPVPQARPGS